MDAEAGVVDLLAEEDGGPAQLGVSRDEVFKVNERGEAFQGLAIAFELEEKERDKRSIDQRAKRGKCRYTVHMMALPLGQEKRGRIMGTKMRKKIKPNKK